MRTSTRSQRSASQLALVCVLALLSNSVLPSTSSLAAYSETRSFRDALEGRSMEEAISGPVDKDTSSYGDRTASSAGATGGSPSGSSMGSASSMLTIPANGNMNAGAMMSSRQQQQDQQSMSDADQQEKSPSMGNPELEREAGPISGTPMDTQQQMMEQKSSRQMSAMRQSARTRNGRLQQQQQQMEAKYPANGKTNAGDSGFGDEQQAKMSPSGSKSAPMAPMAGGYGKSNGSGGGMSAYGADQQPQAAANPDDQQQEMMNGGAGSGQEQEPEAGQKSYQAEDQQQQQQMMMLAKQKAMAAMLMGLNGAMNGMRNGMKYSRAMGSNGMAAAQYGAGDKMKMTSMPSSMAQNMMISLANKAAYASSMSPTSQRQVAPPMMSGASAYNGANQQQQQQSPMYKSMMMSAMMPQQAQPTDYGMSMMNGSQRSGPMRRANQRRASATERKMSPAMVNAMLNKMMNAKQQTEAGYGKATMTPAAMMSMMRLPEKAEMLANMMMMSSPQASAMTPAKRSQYKRMMMNAIMQQAEDSADGSYEAGNGNGSGQEQGQQQESPMADGAYAGQEQIKANGYAMTSGMTPMSMVMNMMGKQKQQQQQQQMMMMNNAYGMDQRRQSMETSKSYGGRQQAPMMMGYGSNNKGAMSPMMTMMMGGSGAKAGAYGEGQQSQMPEQQQQQVEQQTQMNMPQANYGGQADQQQQVMQMNPMPQMTPMMMIAMMNGNKNGDAEQQQQMMMMNPNGGYGNKVSPGMGAYGASGSPMMTNGMASTKGKSMEMSMAGYGGGMGNNEATTQSSYGAGGQQQEMPMEQQREMGAGSKGGANSGSYAIKSPMNGFRQAYGSPEQQDGQQQQQQQQQEDTKGAKKDYGMSSMGKSGDMSGTKSSAATDYSKPMDSQQKQESDGSEVQQQEEGYGAAPMGMAEPFAFDYKIDDNYGNGQYRKEESDKNGVVRGSYGYMDNSGIYRHVEYVADENGFRANIKSNEPGLSSEPAAGKGNGASGSGAQMGGKTSYGAGDDQSQMQMPMPMPMQTPMTMQMSVPMSVANGGNANDVQQQTDQQQQMYSPDQSQAKMGGEKS